MEIQIRNLPDETHKAAKILAAHEGVSLEKFFVNAIHAHTLRVAHQRGLTETVIRVIEKPASGGSTSSPSRGKSRDKARKPARR